MRNTLGACLLLFAAAPGAACAGVAIHGGYPSGEAPGAETVEFRLAGEARGADPALAPFLRMRADRKPLVAEGGISSCDTIDMDGPTSSSTFVRLFLGEQDARTVDRSLENWRSRPGPARRLVFASGNALVYTHDPAMASISESALYLQIGPRDTALKVLGALCGNR